MLHVTVPAACVQSGDAQMNAAPAGTGLLIATLVAGAGPVLLAVSVRITSLADAAGFTFDAWVSARSAPGDPPGLGTPVPETVTVCGEPAALEAMERVAVRAPGSEGLNVTDSAQLAPAATFTQLCVAAKSGSALATFEMVRLAVPLLVMACAAGAVPTPTSCGGKSRPALVNAIPGVDSARPVPTRLRRSGAPTTLDCTISSPVYEPGDGGANWMLKLHSWSGMSVAGHAPAMLKPLPLALTATPVTFAVAEAFL